MMKLSRQRADKIAEEYNLGIVKSLKPFFGGWVNYNYDLRTDNGSYVIRILGLIKEDIKKRLFGEFKVLSYLHKNNFPYAIPYPLKNNRRTYSTKINETFFWVYPKLEGEHIKHHSLETIKSMARALATYHKYVKGIRISNCRKIDSPKILLAKYQYLKEQKPNSPRNKVMLRNIDFFENTLNRIKNIDFNINKLPIHYDFHKGNILFKGDRVVGILDFERMLYAPRILDIAQLIKCTYASGKKRFMERVNLIVKEYKKINSLTKKEEELILPILVKDNCRMFRVFYNLSGKSDLKSSEAEELSCLKWTIDVQKNVARTLGWIR